MRRTGLLALPFVTFSALFAAGAQALTVINRLTPDTMKEARIELSVKARDVGEFRQVELTVTPRTGRLSPLLTARLHLMKGAEEVGVVPLEEKREGRAATYWFQIARNLVPDSKLEWNERSAQPELDARKKPLRDENGAPKYIALPGTRGYWFYLRDFVRP